MEAMEVLPHARGSDTSRAAAGSTVAPDSLFDWIKGAKPGDTVEYFRGNLAATRHGVTVALQRDYAVAEQDLRACEAAADAWDLHERGAVRLLQRRNGPDDFSYLVVRCGR